MDETRNSSGLDTHERWLARLAAFTVERTSDVILWIEADGNIRHANAEACSRYGYTYDEITSLKIQDLNPVYTLDFLTETFVEIRQTGGLLTESSHFTKDGVEIPVEIRINYINFEGREFTCSIVRDIRLRKRKEAALRAAFREIEELKTQLEAENNYLKEEIRTSHNFGEILSQSPSFREVLQAVEQVATTDSTVLITGESGTGKELIARALHRLSRRSERPMIKVNCAALPANLIESELFGYEKGAFTGAVARKKGRFELAHKGTLFLDEIGEMPMELQAKMLRVLQEGEFEPLGSGKTVKVDVRILAATNRDLLEEVKKGEFREDLYYRLNVFPLHCLPLRERKEDIPLLVRHFCKKLESRVGKKIEHIPKKVMDRLESYPYPGNIRELENIIERAVILSRGGKLEIGDWLPRVEKPVEEIGDFPSLERMQREHIVKALQKTNWRVSGAKGAAKLLDMHPNTLESRMKKLGIVRSNEAL